PREREASSHNFGAIRPNPIANRIKIAVDPSERTRATRFDGALTPSSAICTRPAAIRKRKTPGISETTAANAIAAKGNRRRLARGVITSPTNRQDRNDAPYRLPPIDSASQWMAWAGIPTAIGIGRYRHGLHEKLPY